MLALSDTVGSNRLHPLLSAACAADWMETITLELLASSTTHFLMEESRGEPGWRPRVAGDTCSDIATQNWSRERERERER